MKISRIIQFILICITTGSVYAQQTVKGTVYADENANGKKDRNESGLMSIAVSNGRQVVNTDAKGRYELPIGNDDIVFVVKPSGYAVPVNQFNQPQFYYIHKPKGSPPLKFSGVAPTGPLPKSVDFALIPHPENDQFRLLVLGDPQVLDERELGYFDKGIVSEITGTKEAVLGITMGDMVQNDLVMSKKYIEVMGKAGIPWYNVLGNHDMNQDAPSDSLHAETFQSNFGPATYSFNYGKAHFIVLDDNLYPDPRGGKGLWGGYSQKQLEFVENDLKYVSKDQLIVLVNHIQMIGNQHSFRDKDKVALFSKLKGYLHVLALSAHTHQHQQFFHGAEEGWLNPQPLHEFNIGATCGNWYSGRVNEEGIVRSVMSDGTPSGYVYLNIDGNHYSADFKVGGKPADYQMGLYHRQVLSTIWWDNRGFIYANFFMGYKDSPVECRIDNGKWKRMNRMVEPDPAYIAELFRWDDSPVLFKGRRPMEPADCTHLWQIRLPGDIGVGSHRIEVRATDMYGKTFTSQSTYRIEEPTY